MNEGVIKGIIGGYKKLRRMKIDEVKIYNKGKGGMEVLYMVE